MSGGGAIMMLQRELKDLMKRPRSKFFKIDGLQDNNIFHWIVYVPRLQISRKGGKRLRCARVCTNPRYLRRCCCGGMRPLLSGEAPSP